MKPLTADESMNLAGTLLFVPGADTGLAFSISATDYPFQLTFERKQSPLTYQSEVASLVDAMRLWLFDFKAVIVLLTPYLQIANHAPSRLSMAAMVALAHARGAPLVVVTLDEFQSAYRTYGSDLPFEDEAGLAEVIGTLRQRCVFAGQAFGHIADEGDPKWLADDNQLKAAITHIKDGWGGWAIDFYSPAILQALK